jgi:ketosteroid isomerase-like protein
MTLFKRASPADVGYNIRILGFIPILMLLLPMETEMADVKVEMEARNKATIQAGFEAWKNGTGSPYDALADDATWEIFGNSTVSRIYTSKEDFLGVVIRPFNARMSSRLIPSIRKMYADSDTVIVVFNAEGLARDGNPYRNNYAWFLQLRENQIVRASAFFDSFAFNDFWLRLTPTE